MNHFLGQFVASAKLASEFPKLPLEGQPRMLSFSSASSLVPVRHNKREEKLISRNISRLLKLENNSK